ncbi:MAG: aspartate-semialdehyde dehydrogenase [Desulfosudaceae bacterium]
MTEKSYNVAVAGATGLVGGQMLQCLQERQFPINNIKMLASARSAGRTIEFMGETLPVEELTADSFQDVDIAFFSAGGGTSKTFAPHAAEAGCVVIDNSKAWRMDPEVPLVVPEVNSGDVAAYSKKNIIANPNCSTIQMVVALAPIHRQATIKRIVVATYQAVSGTGKAAVDELFDQSRAYINSDRITSEVYPHQIAFNCLPHIGGFLDNGYTEEEMKMVHETRKIMGDDRIAVSATTVRVPVFYSHSESVNVETVEPISAEAVRTLLAKAPGVTVMDTPEKNIYPLATMAAGKDDTFVGRIRQDESVANGIDMWIVSDNIRKGAATNAVQIGEVLIQDFL